LAIGRTFTGNGLAAQNVIRSRQDHRAVISSAGLPLPTPRTISTRSRPRWSALATSGIGAITQARMELESIWAHRGDGAYRKRPRALDCGDGRAMKHRPHGCRICATDLRSQRALVEAAHNIVRLIMTIPPRDYLELWANSPRACGLQLPSHLRRATRANGRTSSAPGARLLHLSGKAQDRRLVTVAAHKLNSDRDI
jgi:hypothetical protein